MTGPTEGAKDVGGREGGTLPADPAIDDEVAKATLVIPNWRRTLSRYRKRTRAGWRLYRQSKSGLIGMGIMLAFVFVAVFAPFLTPYSTDFIAPSMDVFKADYIEEAIPKDPLIDLNDPANVTWMTPLGYNGDSKLESIVIYSREGHVVKFGVDRQASGGAVGIDIVSNQTKGIPKGTTMMMPVSFYRGDIFFAFANESLFELTYDTFTIKFNVSLEFKPRYYSNLWNRWSPTNALGALYMAVANESTVAVYAKVPPNTLVGELTEKRFFSMVSLRDFNYTNRTEIIGDPILIQLPLAENGSLIVVPTSLGLAAFELEVNRSGNRIRDVRIGDIVWWVSYQQMTAHWGREVEPIHGRPITITKEEPSEEQGKERIVLAAANGWLYTVNRVNGSFAWSAQIFNKDLRAARPRGVYPTYYGDLVVTGVNEGRGFIAAMDPTNGVIKGNGTYYNSTPTPVIGRPDYIAGSHNYFFTTEGGNIYIMTETMQLEASFSSPGGGAGTPAAYMGNIINNIGTTQGNYYALVTGDGTMFTQSITGAYRAPLPPGKYPSGNRYLLGTDVFGGDIWTQLIYGTRTELVVGLVAALLSAGLGTIIGLFSAFYGGWIDVLLMRLTDIFLTLPILVVALLMVAVLGPSITNIIIIIAIFSWAGVARIIRAQTLSLKNRSFIDAARVSGASNSTIIFRHLAPNVLPLTFLYMVFTISGAIITEAILAFLGMGDATAITWGMMLQYLRISGNTLTAWWWLLPPGLAITLLSLAFYLIGRAFDEVVNPRLRAR